MRNKNFLLLFLFCFLSIELFAQAPIDDDPCSAIPIPVGVNCNFTQYTNVNATATTGVANPPCTNYQGGDVWFSAVVPASGSIIFDSNAGTMVNSGMAVYTGPCNALTAVACDNNGSANGLMSSITANGLTPGATVYIRMWGVGLNNTGTFSICAKSNAPCTPQGANSGCNTADPFCTDVSYNYCNTTNVPSLGGGGIYGCLFSTPNPAFYYMNVAASGPISFQISQQSNTGVGLDVDFVCWGPFASQAAMCAGLSAANIVACSYSFASVETANIPGALAGQWYMVLITNFSNQQGAINFTQTNTGTAGAGTTNCNILTAIPDLCSGGLYTLTGTVQTQSPPASGTLTVTNSCGGSTVINAPFSTNIPYTIPNLCGNGGSCNVTAVFSAAGAPVILPTSYNAPTCNSFVTVTPSIDTVCSLSGSILTANGATTYTWSPGVGLSSTTGASVTANPIVSTTYTVTGTNASGCTGSATAIIQASPNPIVIVNPIILCSGQSGILNASGALTYTWSPALGLSTTTGISVNANPLSTTTYTVVGTNALGCTGQTTAVVTVNLVNAAISPVNSTICSGGCVTLNGTANSNTTSTTVFNTNPVPNVIPENLIGNSSTINIPGPCPGGIVGVNTVVSVCVQIAHGNFGSIDATLTSPNGTTIDLTSDNGAATGGLITLCFSGSAAQSITSMAVATSGTYQPEQSLSLFSGSSLSGNWVMTVYDDLPGNGTGAFINWSITFQNASLTYSWSPSASLSSANIINPSACPVTSTTYTLLVTDACTGCTANATSVVNVNPPPIINVNNLVVCTGSGGGALTANGATTYTWSPAIGLNVTTGPIVLANPVTSVTYTVVGFDTIGCSASTTTSVTVTPLVVPAFPLLPPLCAGDPVPILPTTSSEGITGTWSPAINNTTTTTYTFTPNNPSQCGTTTTLTIVVDPLPLTTPIYHD